MKRMNARIILGAAVIVAVILFWNAWTDVPENGFTDEKNLRVVATFYPLAEFSRMVGGDLADVSVVVSPGVEPHDYEPTPRDLVSIENADVFVLNGAEMDPWAEKLVPALREKGVSVVIAAESVTLLAAEEHDEHHEEGNGGHDADEADSEHDAHEEEAHEEKHEHGAYDPHFWLDPIYAESIVGSIRMALVEKDADNARTYEANAAAALSELATLDGEYRTILSTCARDEVITSHNAFAYLAGRYGFGAHSIAGLSPEAEPSAGRIAELVDLAKKENIRYIFFETLVSPKVSETLAREIGAETLVFDPLEGLSAEDAAAGKNYFSVMRENLANLSMALECRQ
ncbi:MAG: zinc ABC transporter substrate-binding protein [Candidatus Moranbacteria bacterium]|nr:zinc ABC transporter substrate-binding protein [Candidatus Moranbacteria bacterium]